jgi:hypothetical protein
MSFDIRRCVSGFWFRNDWPAVLMFGRGYNWVDFTFIKLYTEYCKITCLYEFEIALLGLGFGFSVSVGHSEENDELKRRVRMVESGLMETVPLGEPTADGVQIRVAAPLANELGITDK